jgi:hypothetical protein
MTAIFFLSLVSFGLALLPCALYFSNIRLFKPPPEATDGIIPSISVMIPARNEEAGIEACLRSVLASTGATLEVIVLNDHSTDRTAEIVASIAKGDSRVRLESSTHLPPGWSGKQHACFELSKKATSRVLVFLDADVRLSSDCLSRLSAFQRSTDAALVSGFPRQEVVTFFEKLLIPLIHWLLLGFLPLSRMRIELRPSLGAGCGQLFLTNRESYKKAGGHDAIKTSFHDGIQLPRSYRRAGLKTDLCDITDLATCRMYASAGQVWNGLAKNAREGIGKPLLLPIFTILFLMGQVLPIAWLIFTLRSGPYGLALLNAFTIGLIAAPRLHSTVRFAQPMMSALLHSMGIVILLAIQWYANLRVLIGKPIAWKGRIQPV